MSLILVERLPFNRAAQASKPLWLVWVGRIMPPLEQVWKKYLRRFGVDRWYRFAKQRLHWTLPQLSTPIQCQRWSDLMPLMTWQLWLARDLVRDHHLPWQSPQTNLTPGRVAQSMLSLLMELGTPAHSPKTRGKSTGWFKGKKRTPKTRYPVAQKGKHCAKKYKRK
jgi:hypothetical protein